MNEYTGHTAMAWEPAEDGAVNCLLCPRLCRIPDRRAGFCGARENRGGTLYAQTYGMVSSLALDSVEKKPLNRFHPGKRVLSLGSYGCNLNCQFCQNHAISVRDEQMWRHMEYLSPAHIAEMAERMVPSGNIGVAATYNEPLVGYEFLMELTQLVRDKGLLNVVVTNGYINPEPLAALLPFVDAMNIDIKGFSDTFYKKLGGRLAPVKQTVAMAAAHCHVEITALVIPGENDSKEEIGAMAQWLASLDPGIPLHLTRFFPRHQYRAKQPTPQETIYRLRDVAGQYLTYVFAGNMG